MGKDLNPNYLNHTSRASLPTLMMEMAVALGAKGSEIKDEINELRSFISEHHAVFYAELFQKFVTNSNMSIID